MVGVVHQSTLSWNLEPQKFILGALKGMQVVPDILG